MSEVGRPLKYKTPKELQTKIDEYFDYCELVNEFQNILGMVVYLGFADRSSLLDYEQRSDEFFHTVKSAKSKCYALKLQRAMRGEINPTIFIFDSVNNHDMINTRSDNSNRNDNKHSGNVSLTLDQILDEAEGSGLTNKGSE